MMLIWVFTAAAVLCLVYYGVIVLYAGFGTSFAVLWLLIGGFFGATAAGIHFYQKYPERMPLWLPVSFVTRSEEHTSELQSHLNLVCRLLLEKKIFF